MSREALWRSHRTQGNGRPGSGTSSATAFGKKFALWWSHRERRARAPGASRGDPGRCEMLCGEETTVKGSDF